MVLAGNVGRGLQAESPVPDAGLTGAQADELLGDAVMCMKACP